MNDDAPFCKVLGGNIYRRNLRGVGVGMAKRLSDPKVVLESADQNGLRRVLIVTALPLELKAVRRGLKNLGSATMAGATVEFEQFSVPGHEWLVVAGECSAGNHEASLFVTKAIQQFGPFELIIFVGVAATRKPDDAPIGSVMVSKFVYLAGVGKYKGGKFEGRSRQLRPDPTLVSYAEKVVRDEEWQSRITPPYAGTQPDDEDYPKPYPPTAKVCPIVSVEAVSADLDSSLEQQINQAYQDATGLEMEGYGALIAAEQEETPCIVVRGVSDDRIGKNARLDKIHQPIAAGHAAAFAFELLDMWSQNMSPPNPKEPTVSAPPAAPTAPIVATGGKRLSLVLHLRGTSSDYPPERREKILEAVRGATGDSDAELVGAEEGSFNLFVSVLEAAWKNVDEKKFNSKLNELVGTDLIGVTTETEFRAVKDVQTVLLNASEPLLTWPQTLPDGKRLERPELDVLIGRVLQPEGNTTALLGAPGSGKTALLARMGEELTKRGIAFLAIKADTLDTHVATEADLGQALGLPNLPSVLLAELSRTRQVVLLIDQLDALASYLDLKTGRLSVLLNLVRALGGRRNIGVILSARQFEFEHDVRLRSVRAESLILELPPWSAVLGVLQQHGITADSWPPDAQQVLRIPQALTTFLKLSRAADAPPFRNYLAMLEELWQTQLLSLPQGARVVRLAAKLAEDMADREALWVARSRYDDSAAEVDALIAAGVATLSDTKTSIGFSHQTVFDFALARSFADEQGRLSAYINGREASLFIRPKLWSALTYLRGTEVSTYETELRTIWASKTLRAHLRHLILEFLGQQAVPTSAEMQIYKDALASSSRRFALQAMVGSEGWFDYFKSTEISAAMHKPKEAGIATALLSRMASAKPDEVMNLVENHWLMTSEFDGNLWFVLQELKQWDDRVLSVATKLLSRTDIAPFHFEHLIASIGVEQPEVALKLSLAKLQQNLDKGKIAAEVRLANQKAAKVDGVAAYLNSPREALTRLVEGAHEWDSLEALAKSTPRSFLKILWPWFADLLASIRLYENEWEDHSYALSYLLDFRFEGEGGIDLIEYPVLAAFRVAIETLAEQNGSAFLEWLDAHEKESAAPAQRLFAHGLAFQPERYSKRAHAFLLADLRRLKLGHIGDLSDTSKRLVRLVSPFWTDAEVGEFVSAVQDYSPTPSEERDAESRQTFRRAIARMKLETFEQLPPARLSSEVLAEIQRGRRRFGERKHGVTINEARMIGSPMSSEEMAKATNEQVLNAFTQLPDATNWDNPKDWMKGGNIQLSRSFSDFAKAQPARAVQIIDQMTPEIGSRAAAYALDAMGETAEPDLVLSEIKKLEGRGFIGEEYRNGVARAVDRLVRRDVEVDDSVVAILLGWLTETQATPRPATLDDSGEAFDEEDKKKWDDRGSILWGHGGVSILPQGNFPTLEAISRILLRRADYERLISVLSTHLDRTENEKVWEAMLRFLRYIHPKDKATFAALVSKLFQRYPQLLDTIEGAIALAHLQWKIPDVVRTVLVGWTSSSKDEIQQAYGELITLMWLVQPELGWPHAMLEEIVEAGSPYARRGAAYAAVNVWGDDDEHRDRGAALLMRLVAKGEAESWPAVLDIFRLCDAISPDKAWLDLLRAIMKQVPKQATFPSNFVLDRLQTLLPHEAELVAEFALTLTAKWRSELADIRTNTAADAPSLVDIALTLHRLGDSTREKGTELFEELIEINAYTARDTLQQIDNRFPNRAIALRPRLPRRQRRARRRAQKS